MTPVFNDNNLKGVDVYHGDQNLSYHDLAASGVKFVYIKASQGVSMIDPAFQDNYNRAKSVGLLVGAYHFFMPGVDPKTQAEHFLKAAKLTHGDLPYCLDIESYGDGVADDALIAANKIKLETGRSIVPYTGDSFYQDHLAKTFSHNDYILWIARYGAKPHTPCTIWQYADNGSYPHNPPLDSNVFHGNLSDLQKLCL